MKLLLDTHVFLWFIAGDRRLPDREREAIRDARNEAYLSVVSVWEAMVKHQLGKLSLPEPPERYLPRQRAKHMIATLALTEESVARLATLPPLHRDPFDRMLVCQALEHDLTVVTADELVRAYPIRTFTAAQ